MDKNKLSSQTTMSLLVASVLGRDLDFVNEAIRRCVEVFGEILFVSEPLNFSWTEYYRDELGESPQRRIIALRALESPAQLAERKRTSCRLEIAMSRPGEGGRRPVNIDPGYLNADQLILASTKYRGHRFLLNDGIYADLMLLHGAEGFAPLPWTYPDYAEPELRAVFNQLRQLYLTALRMEQQ